MNLSIYLAHANEKLSPIARTGCIPGGNKMSEIVIFPYLLTLAEAELQVHGTRRKKFVDFYFLGFYEP